MMKSYRLYLVIVPIFAATFVWIFTSPITTPRMMTWFDSLTSSDNDTSGLRVNMSDAIPDFNRQRILREGPSVVKDPAMRHDKWIVLTTISKPTEDVMFLAKISGWKVVVVGDTKTPTDWSHPNCVFLSVSKQLALGLKTPEHLPYKHYARKNAGYLYAIAHGADVIYETDDDNRPLDKLASFKLRPTMPGLMFSSDSTTFNPYRHFGQPTLWPRGFPLSQIGSNHKDEYRLFDQWPTPAIQQGVVNGDPDMDAVFRLTRKITVRPLEVNFDPAAPPVILPPGVFSPFNSQNTLFLKPALWAMLIPTTTTFRICDIWRGYWAQRLLWEIGGHIGFFPPNAYQKRSAHDYMADMTDEEGMYFNTDRLVSFLSKWTCPTRLTFFQCAYKLSLDMALDTFWLEGDVTITKYWLEDLIRVGYNEPQRVNINFKNSKLSKKLSKSKLSDLEKRKTIVRAEGTSVLFRASDQPSPEISPNGASTISQIARHADSIAKLCPAIPSVNTPAMLMQAMSQTQSHFHDILLVVIFNWPFFSNAHILETIYRPLFPNIVYCGLDATKFAKKTASISSKGLSFVAVPNINRGRLGQMCTVKAMQMNYNVKGYFIVGDDILLNIWNFRKFDKSKVWMSYGRAVFDITKGNTGWYWWDRSPIGKKVFLPALASLIRLANTETNTKNGHDYGFKIPTANKLMIIKNKESNNTNLDKPSLFHDGIQTRPSTFLDRLKNSTGGANKILHASSDVYYIPSRLREDAIAYLAHFAAYDTFMELAVPVVLYGLENPKQYNVFQGIGMWGADRKDVWTRFKLNNSFLHPLKWSNKENLPQLCSVYLPVLLAKGYGEVTDQGNTTSSKG